MRSNQLPTAFPAQGHPAATRGGDPVLAGIHVLPVLSENDVGGRQPGHDFGEVVQ